MIFVPAIYFSVLSLLIYLKKKYIDLSILASMMYAISGFLSILIDYNDLRSYDTSDYEITFSACFTYCLLLTLCILPISLYNSKKTKLGSLPQFNLLKVVSVISLIWFISTFVFSFSFLLKILTGDMAMARAAAYEGELVPWMSILPEGIRLFFALFNILFSCFWILMFLSFYLFQFEHIPKKYPFFFFISSLSSPLNGVLGADRSAAAYWMISLIVCFIIFRENIPLKVKRKLYYFVFVIILLLIVYLTLMTVSRFGDGSNAAFDSLITYLGQSYINFCFFFDNYKVPYQNWAFLFPFTYYYILDLPAGTVSVITEMSILTGYNSNIFPTFMGQLIIALGQFTALLFVIFYILIFNCRMFKIRKKKNFNVLNLYEYIFFSSIVFLGPFVYYYSNVGILISVIFFYFILKISISTFPRER